MAKTECAQKEPFPNGNKDVKEVINWGACAVHFEGLIPGWDTLTMAWVRLTANMPWLAWKMQKSSKVTMQTSIQGARVRVSIFNGIFVQCCTVKSQLPFIIGSADVLPILCVRCAPWEREREREREKEGIQRGRERQMDVTSPLLC